MASYDFDIGIIGGGAAGLTVAAGAAQLGAKTLLVEKEPELGGDCLHYGCVPSKTLIKSAHIYHLMQQGPRFGLPEVQVPPVDFKRVAQRIRRVIATIQVHDSTERFCKLGARVEFGSPRFSDEHSIVLEGRSFSARHWVLATGSSPMVPPIPGLQETEFLTNREIFALKRLPDSMIFLGAGPIGIEMAQAFARLGSRVTVVDRGDQILLKEDPDMAHAVRQKLEEEGVVFHLESTIREVREQGGRKTVAISNSRQEASDLGAEAVVVAMGRSPNIRGLNLRGIDVAADRFGVKVDTRLRTSQKHIYAAGDVIGGYQFTHAAGYEGGIVVSNAVFRLPRKVDYTHMPWSTYCDPELASIGLNEQSAREQGLEYTVWTEEFQDNDRGLAEGAAGGKIKLLLDGREKPLGVQILGLHAGELMGQWVAALNGRVKLSTLAGAIQPYPTLGEINKRVVGNVFSPKIFSDKVRKGLKFFFNLKGRACEIDPQDGSCVAVE